MFSPLRNRFGIPGVISVIALVFAMFGGAYAATNTGKATSSAKAKKGPRGPKGPKGDTGPAGPAGPAGSAGPKGDTGAKGDAGSAGAAGAPGKSVEVNNESAGLNCAEGGLKVQVEGSASKKYVCNGEEGIPGQPWVPEGTLPAGATMTGTVAGGGLAPAEAPGYSMTPISFPIPLADAPDAVLLKSDETSNEDCPGISAGVPQADPGKLCVYIQLEFSATPVALVDPTSPFGEPGVSKAGSVLQFEISPAASGIFDGVWAVTAPSA